MVKPKDDLNLSLQPQSLTIDAGQDCSPVTPINRSFSNVDTNSFVTAILSPSSHDVFAARARARSRSDAAPPLSSTAALNAASRAVHYSPSLDSINIARPCDTICEGDTSPIKPEGDSQAAPSKPLYGESLIWLFYRRILTLFVTYNRFTFICPSIPTSLIGRRKSSRLFRAFVVTRHWRR
jgi:hypothetical protein